MFSSSAITTARATLGLKPNILLLLLAILFIGFGEELWMRFLPKYMSVLGAPIWAIGMLDALKNLLGALYAYPGGVITDRYGPRLALALFTALSFIGYGLLLFFPRWEMILLSAFLFYAWACFSLPATFSVIAANVPKAQLATGIGVQSVVKRLPMFLAPIAGGYLLDRLGVMNGVRAGIAITMVLCIIALFAQLRIKEPAPVRKPRPRIAELFRTFTPGLKRLLISDVLIRFCERIPFAWVVIFAMDHRGLTASQVGILISIEVMLSLICLIPAARMADKYGREHFVIGTFVFFTLFPLLLLLAGNFYWMILAFAVRGLKEFGEPARKALILSHAAEAQRGQVVGAYYLVRDLLVTLAALLGAWLWKLGPAINLGSATVAGLLGTAFYLYTWKNGRSETVQA